MKQLLVLSTGPLLVIEVPVKDNGDLAVKWRDLLKSVSALMRVHGVKRKDILAIEAVDPKHSLDKFWIYRLESESMTFSEVKKPE